MLRMRCLFRDLLFWYILSVLGVFIYNKIVILNDDNDSKYEIGGFTQFVVFVNINPCLASLQCLFTYVLFMVS